jgi:hypothetical protein
MNTRPLHRRVRFLSACLLAAVVCVAFTARATEGALDLSTATIADTNTPPNELRGVRVAYSPRLDLARIIVARGPTNIDGRGIRAFLALRRVADGGTRRRPPATADTASVAGLAP